MSRVRVAATMGEEASFTDYTQELYRVMSRCSPVSGTVLYHQDDCVYIRLAPGVVGFCAKNDAVPDSRHYDSLKHGDLIAVVVEELTVNGPRLNRVKALEQLLALEQNQFLRGRVVLLDDYSTMLAFGPGFFGMGATRSRPFELDQEVVVRLTSSRLNPSGIVDWMTIKNTKGITGSKLEDVPSLMSRVQAAVPTTSATDDDETASPVTSVLQSDTPTSFGGYDLQPFQSEAIRAIATGDNVILCAPTGSGKTLVADWAIATALEKRRRVIFASPVKALSNQKYRDFQKNQPEENQVGLITGDIDVNPMAPVLVMTTEVFRNRAIESPESLAFFDVVIFDEIHYLDDRKRGSTWEESIIFVPPHMQIIALSAAISNRDALAKWIRDARRHTRHKIVSVIPTVRIERPVKLVHQFCTVSKTLEFYKQSSDVPPSMLQSDDSTKPSRLFKNPEEIENSRAIVDHVRHERGLPAIYFCSQRNDCESYAEELAQRENLLDPADVEQAFRDFDQCMSRYGIRPAPDVDLLRSLIGHGIGFHHSGLSPALKMVVEELFERERIRLLYATDTFAVGVNMPARTVIFDSLCRGYPSNSRFALTFLYDLCRKALSEPISCPLNCV